MTVLRGVAAGLAASVGLAGALGALGRALVAPPDHYVTVRGRRLAVVDQGRGPVVVFLHGLGGQGRNFYRMVPLLDGFRCIAIDRAGAGFSDPAPPGLAGLQAHADMTARVIEALAPGQRVIVAGHSMGGLIALRLTLDRPDLVAGMVGFGALTGPHLEVAAGLGGRIAAIPPLREAGVWALSVPTLPLTVPYFVHAAFSPGAVPPGFAIDSGAILAAHPCAVNAVMRDLRMVDRDAPVLRAALGRVSRPVMLVHGLQDRVLPVCAQAIAAARVIPDARLWLPEGGHMLPVTNAPLCAAAIRETAARAQLI